MTTPTGTLPAAAARPNRVLALSGGLLAAGLLWMLATLVAALIQVGPASDLACPSGDGFRTAERVELGVVPFGPTCVVPDRDRVGAPTGTARTSGPAPIWSRALLAGGMAALAGASGLVVVRRGDSAVKPRR